jgi:hypothetical protein
MPPAVESTGCCVFRVGEGAIVSVYYYIQFEKKHGDEPAVDEPSMYHSAAAAIDDVCLRHGLRTTEEFLSK